MRSALQPCLLRVSKQPSFCRVLYSTTRRVANNSLATQEPEEGSIRRIKRKKDFLPTQKIFSAIQPTGIPHLGNYLGALRKWKELQDEKTNPKAKRKIRLLFMVCDLHALTVAQNREKFFEQRGESYASLLAIGLDPAQSSIFIQSHVPQHTQLMWILSTVASMGYLSRMTQWKSKLGLSEDATVDEKAAREKLRLGLFSYPVLQAADILLYRPTHVPVGEDQAQHIEFARSLAKSFNAHYGTLNEGSPLFEPPKLLLSPARRIMSLRDPTSKMSKSDADPRSRILITDPEDQIHAKIRSAITDSTDGISYDPAQRPGISNLIEILKHVQKSEASCEEIAADNANASMRAFKEHVAHTIINELRGIGDKFHEVFKLSNPILREAMNSGAREATAMAGNTMSQVNDIVGLRRHRPRKTHTGKHEATENKEKILEEQEAEEAESIKEPDVLPQQEEGVDRPIAS